MEEFAHRANVERFERELQIEKDPERRAMIEKLLEEERAHLERLRKARGSREG